MALVMKMQKRPRWAIFHGRSGIKKLAFFFQSVLLQYFSISLASVLMTVILLTGYAGMRDRHVSRAQLNRKYVQGAVC